MNEQEASQLVQRLYDSIFTMLTGSSDGGPAAYDPNKTFITLNKGGQLINPADFRNQWSPGNLDGDTDATQRFVNAFLRGARDYYYGFMQNGDRGPVIQTLINHTTTPVKVDGEMLEPHGYRIRRRP